MATISNLSRSILSDTLSLFHKPVYEGEIRPQLMSKVEPFFDEPETVTKEFEYGEQTREIEVRPVTNHWSLYYMDSLRFCGGPGGMEAHKQFLQEHIPAFGEVGRVEDLPVNLSKKLTLAVRDATLEYYEDSGVASPHYIQ